MGKHLLAKAHIAKLNKLTVSEVTELTRSTVDETALAILKRQGSRGIPIVSSRRKIKLTIQVLSILTELTDKNALNWQQRNFKLPNFTKTPAIGTTC